MKRRAAGGQERAVAISVEIQIEALQNPPPVDRHDMNMNMNMKHATNMPARSLTPFHRRQSRNLLSRRASKAPLMGINWDFLGPPRSDGPTFIALANSGSISNQRLTLPRPSYRSDCWR